MWHSPPDRDGGQASVFIAAGEDIKKRLSGAQHPPPVVPDKIDVWAKTSSFFWVKKPRLLIQFEDLLDRQSVDFSSVSSKQAGQSLGIAQHLPILCVY